MEIKSVIKRDGTKVAFDKEKIVIAIGKAVESVYDDKITKDEIKARAEEYADEVTKRINGKGVEEIAVEDIQDIVEQTLMEKDSFVAKAYIIYRNKRAELRNYLATIGITDDLKLPLNTLIVLAARYLQRDENRKIIETPKQLFERVSKFIAGVEHAYGTSEEKIKEFEESIYKAMTSFEFMPNSPTLMNAGTKLGQLSACFVLPVGDSIPEIFDAVKWAALVHQSGGGTGFSFSRLRPAGDVVRSTGGIASGPISFMKVFDSATEQIKQGGKRRGANMGILRVDHPDILSFIVAKEKEGVLENFNISVAITDEFMKALQNNSDYNLINPRNGKVVGKLNARAVWNLITTMAWRTGDPGVVFIDRMNSSTANPVPKLGPIESTNP
ncbi:MAG: ribonucleotide reductase N-terminal alpha domain-containing protein, partial [Candidatus Micrarchaeaceae archaeon]